MRLDQFQQAVLAEQAILAAMHLLADLEAEYDADEDLLALLEEEGF